jgi:hypothetical protein
VGSTPAHVLARHRRGRRLRPSIPLDQRIANASRDGVFSIPGTQDAYTNAWRQENARYCTPDNAFERGRGSIGMAVEVCAPACRTS